jgi:site-specific DNA-methyltransferase (adenine-specific)
MTLKKSGPRGLKVHTDSVRVFHGDCLDVLKALPDESIDSVVTDPPYGLGFMGKAWDAEFIDSTIEKRRQYVGDTEGTTSENGGYRSAAAEAGRYDLSREGNLGFQEWCELWARECLRVLKPGGHMVAFGGSRTYHRLAVAVEDAGFEIRDSLMWLYGSGFPKSRNIGNGWGTALKPAHEPIVVGRKPFKGPVAANVLTHGTGAINIDASRVGTGTGEVSTVEYPDIRGNNYGQDREAYAERGTVTREVVSQGRWPTNVSLTHAEDCEEECEPHCPVAELDRHKGGASRFFPVFKYQPKAPSRERPKVDGKAHPTVKPLALMEWLITLVTPPNGVVLDPFAGSGTTLQAAANTGFQAIGIEREDDYIALIKHRLGAA